MDPALILLLKQKLTPFLGPPLKENSQQTSAGDVLKATPEK
jgi:hypothetical protein